ncbi:LacI family transcriptional regulator [Eubacteriales bacterium OttesenSCG-928-K08]|nr:LacI family transcriptional regulator [Eubacteriales bacterium OttesenSCG-928-K08]
MRKVTIKDVAREANVSYATVSRSLSGSPEISEETRARVLKICEEMGYTPNYIARSMVAQNTKVLGLIVAHINNPFMSEIAYHVEATARKRGYNIMLCNSSHDLALEKEVFSLMIGRQVDGVIIMPCKRETYENLKPLLDKTPTVFISENLKDLPESYVAVDNFRGTYIGMEYLYELGHRKICYFGNRQSSTTHALRVQGYKQACTNFGLTPMISSNPYSSSTIAHGYKLALELFAKERNYTAIVAATDTMALGVLQAADEMGVDIPKDISLLGFDNINFTELPKINLSTIEQPKKAMATAAVDMLIDKINNPQSGYSHRILMPTLIRRKSCLDIK